MCLNLYPSKLHLKLRQAETRIAKAHLDTSMSQFVLPKKKRWIYLWY